MTTHSYSCSHVLWDPECANIALPRSPVTGPADGGECAIMTAGDARVKPPSLIALWGSCWIEKATLLEHQGETSAAHPAKTDVALRGPGRCGNTALSVHATQGGGVMEPFS
jgi:hypothetical protein